MKQHIYWDMKHKAIKRHKYQLSNVWVLVVVTEEVVNSFYLISVKQNVYWCSTPVCPHIKCWFSLKKNIYMLICHCMLKKIRLCTTVWNAKTRLHKTWVVCLEICFVSVMLLDGRQWYKLVVIWPSRFGVLILKDGRRQFKAHTSQCIKLTP